MEKLKNIGKRVGLSIALVGVSGAGGALAATAYMASQGCETLRDVQDFMARARNTFHIGDEPSINPPNSVAASPDTSGELEALRKAIEDCTNRNAQIRSSLDYVNSEYDKLFAVNEGLEDDLNQANLDKVAVAGERDTAQSKNEMCQVAKGSLTTDLAKAEQERKV